MSSVRLFRAGGVEAVVDLTETWLVTGQRMGPLGGLQSVVATSFGQDESAARAFFRAIQTQQLRQVIAGDSDPAPTWSDSELTFTQLPKDDLCTVPA